MKGKYLFCGICLAAFMLAAVAIRSQEAPRKPAIDPEAESVLRQMSDHLKQVQTTILRVTDTIDDVQADGRKLQFAHVREMTVMRPDKLKIETMGDVTNRTVWLDGKTLTVFDKNKNVYAQIAAMPTIEQTIDRLQQDFNMSLPASDLLSADVYANLTKGCNEVNYIGLGCVGEEKCHHLAFSGDQIDYQLWISAGDQPAPRKLVITYKKLPGEPQYTMQLLRKEDPRNIKDSVFACEIPKDAEKIEFRPVNQQQ